MELWDISCIKRILKKYGFNFSKAMGQNFLTDPTVCPAMAEQAIPDREICALEIGPGIGVLTHELALRAKKVVAVELDRRLIPILGETLAEHDNVTVVEGDAMKLDLAAVMREHFGEGARVAVCANLPYYITSPVIMKLLEEKLPIERITAMVQKEAGERLCAPMGMRECGAVTAAVDYYAEGSILFEVDRSCFTPVPGVDSCVIDLKIRKEPAFCLTDERFYFSLVRGAFSQRRKTLTNSASGATGLSSGDLAAALDEVGVPRTARIEQLTSAELAAFAEAAYRIKQEKKNV